MVRSSLFAVGLVLVFFALSCSPAFGDTVETTFRVANLTANRLCQNQVISAVNGTLPGPALTVKEGDTVIVHVINNSPYNVTIHWHGVFQRLTQWADGPEFVTQCPIRPGGNYTYRFNLTGQVGTLWWHAHSQWLRATVHGALIIRPRDGQNYPFAQPDLEDTIMLGEWWNADPNDVENAALANGSAPANADAYTINGWPGDLFNSCQSISNNTYRLNVAPGQTILLRIINVALNNQFFFKIANHSFTVVAIDAAYTNPYQTDVIVIGPGQTTDVLLTANQSQGLYYMAAHPYVSAVLPILNTNITTAILVYPNATQTTPILPDLPAFNDTPTAHTFLTNLTALTTSPFWSPVPQTVDENMFITFGLGLSDCGANLSCGGLFFERMAASMNNLSFALPTSVSILEAFYRNISGVYTTDFPDQPPTVFDYTNISNSFDQNLLMTNKSTSLKRLRFNSTVQIVLQNTALIGVENHPMHLHGFNFYVLAQGFGNYDAANATSMFNMVNPQERNTLGVPVGGWAVIRFRANNPGVWFFHCHLEVHLPWGLGMAFLVENGGTPESTLPPPPADFPQC
ncbi:putative laccase [Helianthus annuus]|nr:putative laccase [Helianthus annuus]